MTASNNTLAALNIGSHIQDIVEPQNDVARELAEKAAAKLAGTSKESGIRKIMQQRGSNISMVSPFFLRPVMDRNARDFSETDNEEHVETLCQSIMEKGVEKPIIAKLAKDGMLEIIDGESRWRATMRAINVYGCPIESVPVMQPAAGKGEADFIADQNTANMNKPFHDMELAVNVRKLIGWGWSFEKIEKQAGVKVDKAKRLLAALELPLAVQKMIRTNQVPLTTALGEAKKAESGEALVKSLQASLDIATASGRKKVSQKHLDRAAGVISTKAALSGAKKTFEGAVREEREDGRIAYVFDAEQAAQFEAFLAQKAAEKAPVDDGQTDIEDALAAQDGTGE